jgi:hypothetical protein
MFYPAARRMPPKAPLGQHLLQGIVMQRLTPRSGPGPIFLAVSASCIMIMVVAASGLLERFSGGTGIPRALAAQTVGLYWLLFAIASFVVTSWRNRRAQLLLLVANIVVIALLLEGAMRLIGRPEAMIHFRGVRNRTVHHIYGPNLDMYGGTVEGARFFVHTNEDGLRSHYSREAFREYPVRIVVLGDSMTFGFAVDQPYSYPAQLERILRAKLGDENVAVLNAGVISSSPYLQKLLMREAVAHYRPTLVLSVLDATDIGDDIIYPREAVMENGRPIFSSATEECGAITEIRYYGALWEIVRDFALLLEKPLRYPFDVIGSRLGRSEKPECDYNYYDFEKEIDGTLETNRFFIYRHSLEHTAEDFERTLQNLREVAAGAREAGAAFAMAVLPRFHHWNPKEASHNWEHDLYELDEPYQFEMFRFFEGARTRVDFPIVNLLPDFQATDQFPIVFDEDPHLNRAGNIFVAESVARHLFELDLLPSG